jgi:hypothetical protein
MATYYIDFNRGSDAAAGTSQATAWKNLTKLQGLSWSPGDMVLLADDSTWDTPTRANITNCNGTANAPIIFDRYNPSGGASTSYPLIMGRYVPAPGDWTWDAARGAWYISEPLGITSGFATNQGQGVCLLGPKKIHATYIRAFFSPNTPFTADGQWSMDGTNYRYYLRCPSNANPTDYFGGVIFGRPINSYAPFLFNKCGSHVYMRNLRFEQCGVGVLMGIFNTGGAADVTGFRVENCQARDVGNLFRLQADFVLSSFEFVSVAPRFTDNKIEKCAAAAFHLNNVINPYFARNVGLEATCASWGLGYIYIDSSDTHPRTGGGVVEYNDFRNVGHGSQNFAPSDNTFDGAAIYLEAGSQGVHVRGNYVADCHTAMQDNSGRGEQYWTGNVIDNCGRGFVISDQSTLANARSKFWGNTVICEGGADTMPGGSPRCAFYVDGVSGDQNDFQNNFIVAPQTYAFKINITSGIANIGNNWVTGATTPVASLGNVVQATPAGVRTDDPSPYFDVGSGRPKGEAQVLTGSWQGYYQLANGRARPGRVPVGAYLPPRTTFTSR